MKRFNVNEKNYIPRKYKVVTSDLLNNIILQDTKLKLMDLPEESDIAILIGDVKAFLSETDR